MTAPPASLSSTARRSSPYATTTASYWRRRTGDPRSDHPQAQRAQGPPPASRPCPRRVRRRGADALTLFERFEAKLQTVNGNLRRAAVELSKDWRTDRLLRRLEALLVVADRESSLIVSGTGDVIEPEDGVCAIGSGGNFALAAARALVQHSTLDARQIVEEALRIAAAICVYTNDQLVLEELEASPG